MHTTINANLSKRRRRSNGRPMVGPQDQGRRMSLEQFSRADPVPGYIYELGEGVVEVTNIPGMPHNSVVATIRDLLGYFRVLNPGIIKHIGGGVEAKIEMWGRESERHPDISLYLTNPPEGVAQPWDQWTPDIVIEVVSESSVKRDYEIKREEYLAAGVREYWIIDSRDSSALFLVRRADGWIEKRLTRRGKWRTRLLPGFVLELSKVFETSRRRK